MILAAPWGMPPEKDRLLDKGRSVWEFCGTAAKVHVGGSFGPKFFKVLAERPAKRTFVSVLVWGLRSIRFSM